jgi:hypothetical protein
MGTASDFLSIMLKRDEIDRSLLSHRFRVKQRSDGRPIEVFEEDLVPYVGDHQLPNPREQTDNLVLWVGNHQPSPATFAQNAISAIAASIGAMISPDSDSVRGFDWLWSQIGRRGLFEHQDSGDLFSLRLTINGWEQYNELKRRMPESRIAFMAMKFGDPVLDSALTQCFQPAALAAGFELRPLNERQGAGLIDNQIRVAIRGAAFVVADLTHDNNGAYFEAGFAEGIGLHVIYTCEAKKFEEKKTHFDTNHMVTVIWAQDAFDDAARKLAATIRNTLPDRAAMEYS